MLRTTTRSVCRSTVALCLLLSSVTGLYAQSPLDIGFHFSPHLRYIDSSPREGAPEPGERYTTGGTGISMNVDIGGDLEVALTEHWYVRAGLSMSYKRLHYKTTRVAREEETRGFDHVRYTDITIPVKLIYRPTYERHYDNWLFGIGTDVTRSTGSPYVLSEFSDSDDAVLTPAGRSISVFAGYERYLSSTLVLGMEPYLAYNPTEFSIGTQTTAKVLLEAGLTFRLRIDN